MDNHLASIRDTAFECPHCGAFTTQQWYRVYIHENPEDKRTPLVPTLDAMHQLEQDRQMPAEDKEGILRWMRNVHSKLVFINEEDNLPYIKKHAYNIFLSECFNCNKFAVWVYDSLVFPSQKMGPAPNSDIPSDVLLDYEEARSIVNLSPRGAAALLRLCIQKICIFLGRLGKNLDEDIAALVSSGLNPLVQKALDIVRVIGNEAVHPGELDLKDDVATANQLFGLVNIITEQMISHPKRVGLLYDKLPENKRKAIEKRDSRNRK